MIGRKALPEQYEEWNEKWGAPFGFAGNERNKKGMPPFQSLRETMKDPGNPAYGPFAFQSNSFTRVYEYPWAFHAAQLASGLRVLDIGGALSGLQFVVAKEGCEVVNVDPTAMEDYEKWADFGFIELTTGRHQTLNELFGTKVQLCASRIQDAELEDGSFDRIFCLSVLEHTEPDEAADMLATTVRLLRPGGLLILSVDLFLDLKPFGILDRNCWGINHNVGELVAKTGLDMVYGRKEEILGFPEFDKQLVIDRLPELLVSRAYPVTTQTMVLQKQSS